MVRKFIISGFVLLVFLSSFASAEIMLNQPSAVYNLGDELQVSATIKPSQASNGYAKLRIVCGNQSEEFYRQYLSLSGGEEKKIETSVLLLKSVIGNLEGNCKINADYLGESEETQTFELSDEISADLSAENMSVSAGEQIKISGTCFKKNRKPVNGFVEIKVERVVAKEIAIEEVGTNDTGQNQTETNDTGQNQTETKSIEKLITEETDIHATGNVKEGKFELLFSFPENAKSGEYVLRALVYEKIGEETTNEGKAETKLDVRQTPSKIVVDFPAKSIIPEHEFKFKATVYDQADDFMNKSIGIKIYDEKSKSIGEDIISESGEEKTIYIQGSDGPGYWKIEAFAFNLSSEKLFYIEEYEKARFSMKEDKLTITNTGNVVYRKPIEISVGEYKEVKNIELGINESMQLELSAPEGEYNVSVSDGITEIKKSKVALTGEVIKVRDSSEKTGTIAKYPLVWLFLLLVCGVFIALMGRKIYKKKSISIMPQKTEDKINKKSVNGKPPEKKEGVVKAQVVGEGKEAKIEKIPFGIPAEHTLVLHGNKEDVSLLALKIKNLANLGAISRQTLSHIEQIIAENRGAVYKAGDYLIPIFSPSVTRTFDNGIIAVKVSQKLNETLKEHNRKFRDRIDYGISLNSGELISKKEKDKFRFTGMGNTIPLAKKLANLAHHEVLLSGNINQKIIPVVKTEKLERDGINVYKIKRIIDREKNKNFIQNFLNRQKEQERKK